MKWNSYTYCAMLLGSFQTSDSLLSWQCSARNLRHQLDDAGSLRRPWPWHVALRGLEVAWQETMGRGREGKGALLGQICRVPLAVTGQGTCSKRAILAIPTLNATHLTSHLLLSFTFTWFYESSMKFYIQLLASSKISGSTDEELCWAQGSVPLWRLRSLQSAFRRQF